MEKPLPVRLLSTRALGNAARDFIHHQNWLVDMVSMIEVHGVFDIEKIKPFSKEIERAGNQILLIFSSENAVKWVKSAFEKYSCHFPAGLNVATVGTRARLAAIEYLQAVPVITESNSADLLKILSDENYRDTRFFFLCGNKRLNTLPDGLRNLGFSLKEYIVYETLLTPHKVYRQYDFVLFFSPSAVDSFFSVNEWSSSTVPISIGQTTSAVLKKYGVQKILEAEQPSEISMLEMVEKHFDTQRIFKLTK